MKLVISITAVAALVVLAIFVNVSVFQEPLKEWFKPQPILTFAGVLVGFIVLRWQLAAQHRNTLRANAENDRGKLSLEIYRDISAASEEAERAVMALYGLTTSADFSATFAVTPPRVDEFREAANKGSDAMVSILARIQRWEIAFGGGHSRFAETLRQKLDRVRETLAELLALLEKPGDALAVQGAIDPARRAILELVALLWDLRIESQNLLLGGLFDYRVPRRQPTGPGVDVPMTLS